MPEKQSVESIPFALEPPIQLGGEIQHFDSWVGEATLRKKDNPVNGIGRVFLDLLPIPQFRFEFTPFQKPSLKDIILEDFPRDCVLECGPPIGPVSCNLTRIGEKILGHVEDQVSNDNDLRLYNRAVFLVLNGPSINGLPINRKGTMYRGRILGNFGDTQVTVDSLCSEPQPRRSIYEPTHVAECVFSESVSRNRIDRMREDLFRTLSVMKCRWVGVLGPWLEVIDTQSPEFRLAITKTTRNGPAISWCHETMTNCFSDLAPAIFASFADKTRADALQTALHWLIESEQCAGGVEGAIILQQAALECLAWLAIAVDKKICSESGFKGLPAADKIRWLLSLHKIDATIPSASTGIRSYAAEFNQKDMIDVLVDVRNALVHAEPKKAARLFTRNQGNEERGDLWFQIGGILQQAFLASIGYQGDLMRRDTNVRYAANAVMPAPWVTPAQEARSDV
jgi:hypothetical protein